MFLIYLMFAFWAFILASNFTEKFWIMIASALIAFVVMALIINFFLEPFIYIAVGIYALLTIFLLIRNKL